MEEPKEGNEKLPEREEPSLRPPEKKGEPGKLSAEEQMERYEEDLKESDWGHQPC